MTGGALRMGWGWAILGLGLLAQEAASQDFSQVPGVVVAHRPAESKIYIGSPGIVVLPNGDYLAKHDEFGPNSTERERAITHVYRSTDRGGTWQRLATVEHLFWASIFVHNDAVYMLGTSAGHRHGHCVIRRSTDGGRTWSEARDERSGLLFADLSYHTAPGPVVIHKGRLWRAMEDEKAGGGWGRMFRTFMMSAPVEADLLDAASWTSSRPLAREPGFLDGAFRGWLEGNAVVDPDGNLVNILRVNVQDPSRLADRAALVHITADGTQARFSPERDWLDLPGGATKFTIRYDEPSGAYWALTNPTLGRRDRNAGSIRNTLALVRSENLRDWQIRCVLLHHPDVERHGFQYPDWVVEGDDLLAAVRTAYDDGQGGAHRAHDANFLTFHRFKNFRDLTLADSVVEPESLGLSPE